MIAHVAEAGENRGRIVLRLSATPPSLLAIEAAMHLASAYQAEIEAVFVENAQLFDVARYSFATEITALGSAPRGFAVADAERELKQVASALLHDLERRAKAAGVPLHSRVMRDEPRAALLTACAERGPWNVVALTEPFAPAGGHEIAELLEAALQATAVMIVGPRSRRITGPIVLALEDAERLPGMLHAAERLAGAAGERIIVLVLAEDVGGAHELEAQVRLLLGERNDLGLVSTAASHGVSDAVAEAIRAVKPGFVIAEFGRLVVPHTRDVSALAAALECPLLLVR